MSQSSIHISHRWLIFLCQLAVVLTSFFTEYIPSYHGQSSFYFFAYLTHCSNTLLTFLNLLNTFSCFREKTNVSQFCVTCSLFVLVAWAALVVPFNVKTLENPVSTVEHLCPAIIQSSVLLRPVQPPRKLFIFAGYAYLIIYLTWTLVFSLSDLTIKGNEYIYSALNWGSNPAKSSIYVVVALGIYTVMYFGVDYVTRLRIRNLEKYKTEYDLDSVSTETSAVYEGAEVAFCEV
ncbi:hypothetical protein TrVE_jg12560 [Triparma verrucosa]|uniref:Uncharacterized protein n=1 Tax=Triparma verrucosa TaxID=1606542 RepID=A0A9W7ELN7_9STRA|nr:hypothetical protein TrVE_jg12560 [Triparma verrucosa]